MKKTKALVKGTTAVPKLLEIEKARDLIARCAAIDEAKGYRDAAEALRIYHRQQKASRDSMNDAGEIKLRAERKLGELLRQQRQEGLRANQGTPHRKKLQPGTSSPATLRDLGIDKSSAKRWQDSAKVPAPKFEKFIKDKRAEPNGEITSAGLRKETMPEVQRAERVAKVVAKVNKRIEERAAAPEALGVYAVFDADPAWRYEDGTTDPTRQIENHYPTMSVGEICALGGPLGNIIADDAILFLHYPPGFASAAARVVEAWGFCERSGWVWVKPSIGPGYWGRMRHENIMIATRGNIPAPAPGDRPDSVLEAARGEHSAKPVEVYERIEKMFPELPKLELFARVTRPGWKCLGYDVGTGDIAKSLRDAGKHAGPVLPVHQAP